MQDPTVVRGGMTSATGNAQMNCALHFNLSELRLGRLSWGSCGMKYCILLEGGMGRCFEYCTGNVVCMPHGPRLVA